MAGGERRECKDEDRGVIRRRFQHGWVVLGRQITIRLTAVIVARRAFGER
jgi:hypothetical protein